MKNHSNYFGMWLNSVSRLHKKHKCIKARKRYFVMHTAIIHTDHGLMGHSMVGRRNVWGGKHSDSFIIVYWRTLSIHLLDTSIVVLNIVCLALASRGGWWPPAGCRSRPTSGRRRGTCPRRAAAAGRSWCALSAWGHSVLAARLAMAPTRHRPRAQLRRPKARPRSARVLIQL